MIIVAGIARSGLTVTMQMLHAGGFPCVGDPPAFEPFPIDDIPWSKCEGRAVKAVDIQLQFPPPGKYKVILLSRDLKQQAKSTKKFLGAVTGFKGITVRSCVKSLKKDYKKIHGWVYGQDSITVRFEDIIDHPRRTAKIIADFVGMGLDIDRMRGCIFPRSSDCYPKLLELEFLKTETS